MTKFIFGLSLMVVVLTIGCFTFPLDEYSTSTNPLLVARSLPDHESTDFMKLSPLTNEMRFETSTYSFSPMFPKQVPRKPRVFGESESSESFTSTTIVPFHVRGVPDLSLTSAESTTELIHHLRSLPVEDEKENEDASESESDKREVLELTTSYMPSFTSTSSDVAPKYYKSESSTQKYVGRLDESSEEGSESIKFKKLPKSKVELTTETNFPPAQLEQNPGDLLKYTPGGIMTLEENTTAVTSIPEKLKTTTIKKPIENSSEEELKTTHKPKIGREDPLNQGKEPSFTEAPQPDN
jgi:hypothetical protein